MFNNQTILLLSNLLKSYSDLTTIIVPDICPDCLVLLKTEKEIFILECDKHFTKSYTDSSLRLYYTNYGYSYAKGGLYTFCSRLESIAAQSKFINFWIFSLKRKRNPLEKIIKTLFTYPKEIAPFLNAIYKEDCPTLIEIVVKILNQDFDKGNLAILLCQLAEYCGKNSVPIVSGKEEFLTSVEFWSQRVKK